MDEAKLKELVCSKCDYFAAQTCPCEALKVIQELLEDKEPTQSIGMLVDWYLRFGRE